MQIKAPKLSLLLRGSASTVANRVSNFYDPACLLYHVNHRFANHNRHGERMNFDAVFRSRRSNVMATRGMVATSQPLAAQAGLDILKAGGNAADAAVATAAMLNVVEPISTGIGGDCFALYYDAETQTVTALNGSGRASAAASIADLRSLGYTRMPTFTGHAVSVPGTVAGWSDLLERHGRMTLADVLQPAIWTAEHGYPVSEMIAHGWRTQVKKLLRAPDWQSGDLDNGPEQPSGHELLIDGRAPHAGEIMRIPTLAQTLRGIAAEGKDYIYQGEFAERLSEHVQRYGGWITPADMAAHHSTWDEPITADYRGVVLYECPPNGQGLAAIIAANLAAGFDLAAMSPLDRTAHDDRVHAPGLCRRPAVGLRPACRADSAGGAGQRRICRPAPATHPA